MRLDFTALNEIASQGAKSPISAPLDEKEGKPLSEEKKPLKVQNTCNRGAIYRLEAEQMERANARTVYKEHQQNIKKSGALRSDVLKGINEGESPLSILLKAVECISLMTGDEAFYNQSKNSILAVYGWGLGDPSPLEAELKEVDKRLAMLKRAELGEENAPPDIAKRVNDAIVAHEALKEKLEKKMGKR